MGFTGPSSTLFVPMLIKEWLEIRCEGDLFKPSLYSEFKYTRAFEERKTHNYFPKKDPYNGNTVDFVSKEFELSREDCYH